ncbi:unnamed protein product, partial [Choristocarpus tenellus]
TFFARVESLPKKLTHTLHFKVAFSGEPTLSWVYAMMSRNTYPILVLLAMKVALGQGFIPAPLISAVGALEHQCNCCRHETAVSGWRGVRASVYPVMEARASYGIGGRLLKVPCWSGRLAYGSDPSSASEAAIIMNAASVEGIQRTVEAQTQADHICIVGGGFGGLYTALRLNNLPWRGRKPQITLVDKRDKFTFLPLLYEFAVGNAELDEVAPTFRDLLAGTDISFVQGTVDGLNLEGKEVMVSGAVSDDLSGCVISDDPNQSRPLKYNTLVLALGGDPTAGASGVKGALENAIPFYTIEDSYRVKQAVRNLK